MPLDPAFVADCFYDSILIDEILEVDLERSLVRARMPTHDLLPLTRDQRVHPSINIDELDPVFEIAPVRGEPWRGDVRYALKTSAGFGGHNCALVFERI